MKKTKRALVIALSHVWNSIQITLVAVIWTIPYLIRGGLDGLRCLWLGVVPELCERQNKLYSTYWKTGKIDHSIFKNES